MVPHSPNSPQSYPVDNFLNIRLTKNIYEHKGVELDFLYGLYTCLISIFINNKCAISQMLYFLFFKISQISLFWSQITIFIIEISLKLHLQTKYGWNNANSHRLCLKSQKLHFLLFLAAQKFTAHTNIQIHVTVSIFILNWFFFQMLVTMSSVRINKNWRIPKKC